MESEGNGNPETEIRKRKSENEKLEAKIWNPEAGNEYLESGSTPLRAKAKSKKAALEWETQTPEPARRLWVTITSLYPPKKSLTLT